MCGFEGVWRGERIRRTEVEIRVGKLKNGKVAGTDEVHRRDQRWVDWILRLCTLAFECGFCLNLEVCCDCSTVQG